LAPNSHPTPNPSIAQSALCVLLVEDNLAEARLLQEVLKGHPRCRFTLVHRQRLGDVVAEAGHEPDRDPPCPPEWPPESPPECPYDVALLDLTLPDSSGLDSLDALLAIYPQLPVVVLTNTNDDNLAVQAVRHGAQDYLMKRHLQQELLVRSLFYAIARQQAEDALKATNEALEARVRERTAALESANQQLRQEIAERQRIQTRLTLAQEAAKMDTFEWVLPPGGVPLPLNWPTTWPWEVHDDDLPALAADLNAAIDQAEGLHSEFRVLAADGSIRWVAIRSRLFTDDEPPRLLGIHMDITAKKQLEEQFLRAQRLESLGTLASGIAHDLNNLLTPILLAVQLLPLQLPDLDDSARRKLAILESSAQQGANLVKQILAFARGVEGKRFALDISHLLRDVYSLIRQTLPPSITISLHTKPHLWSVRGDATQLHQVLMNLCVNARDAMDSEGTLTLSAQNWQVDEAFAQQHLHAQVGPYVQVTVTDTGCGMAPAVLQRIFDPFFTTKALGQGTGLGLSAVLGIVESHDGFLDVQSQPYQGSRFALYLPAAPTAAPTPTAETDLPHGRREWVLVVDDEPTICEITRAILETHNYRVMVAQDGLAAVALMTKHKTVIDWVLIDMMMPTMDGPTAIPRLKRLNPDLRIIAMGGLHSKATAMQARSLGFEAFLAKPFTAQDLLICLHRSRP